MKKTFYLIGSFLFLLLGKVARADIPSYSGDIRNAHPWYSYFVLGVFIVIVASISMVLLAKIKYRKKKNDGQIDVNKK